MKICAKHPELEGLRRNRECVGCHKDRRNAWGKTHPRKWKDRNQAYKDRTTAKIIAINREKRKLNPEKFRAIDAINYRAWYAKNLKRAHEADRAWREANRERFKNYARQRHDLIKAQPLARAYKEQIAAIYCACPVGMHVDHIVPLKGREVCGLHVPWNMQYLTPKENISKGNRLGELGKWQNPNR